MITTKMKIENRLYNILVYISNNLLYSIRLILLFFLYLTACTEKDTLNTLGETELYFDEKVASLSSGTDEAVWVGSENGRLLHVKGNSSDAFDVGEGRIYKVVSAKEEDGHTSLWIGVRNSGLQKWEMDGEHLRKLQTYPIPLKEDKYSPYDMVKTNHSMYVATTQGLYQLPLSTPSDSMRLIYPPQEVLTQNYDRSFIVNNLFNYKDSVLWAATERGALRVNMNDGSWEICYPELAINHISLYNDTLFALSDNNLYLSDVVGKPLGKIQLKFSPKVYYQAAGVHYMTDRDNVLLSNDLKNFKLLPLRRKIADKCRNVILPDVRNDFTLLLMEDALWRIPNHTGVFNSNGSVKLACSGKGYAYYLTSDNELYCQQGNESEAFPLYSFPKEEQIVWMCTVDEMVYYYNTKQEVKEFSVSRYPLKNQFFHSPRTIYQSKHKITSAYLKKKEKGVQLYLGIQDGLLLLDTEQHVDAISDFSHRYVTSFFAPVHSDMLYLSTLNSGVFYSSSDTTFKSIPDKQIPLSVKDLIVTGDYPSKLIFLTNHDILLQGSADTIPARECNKLLYVNDTLFYALSESGIRKIMIDDEGNLQDSGRFYTDIRFNPAAAFVRDGHLFLGSNLGVLTMKANEEGTIEWLSFRPNEIISLKYLLILLFCLSLVVALSVFRYMRRKHASKERLTKRITHLKACAEELASFYTLSDDKERYGMEQLKSEIDKLNSNTANRKELNLLIGQFTDEIYQRNRKAILKLLGKLEKQIAWINSVHAFDCDRLLEESRETHKSNDIDRIKRQVNVNETWINEFLYLENEVKWMNEELDGCIKIEGVTSLLVQELSRISEEIGQKSLAELLQTFQMVKAAYEELYSDKTLVTILEYITGIRHYLNDRKEPDAILDKLQNSLEEMARHTRPEERIELLKELSELDKRIEFLRLKDKIEECMDKYTLQREKIVDENEQLINKKFDKELESCIAEKNKEYVERLERLIVSMYKLLSVTDPSVLTDLLKISSYYHQQAKVLALLIACPRVKRSLIPGMLGIYGNLNPVISRLINNKIKANEETLKIYMDEAPLHAPFVYYVLKLVE